MKKFLKLFILFAAACLMITPNFNAFFLGSDKYGLEQYKEAGVVWNHNTILKDDYDFCGRSISQRLAEELTLLYNKFFKDRIGDKNKDSDIYNLYVDTAHFIIDIAEGALHETMIYRFLYINRNVLRAIR